MSGERTYVDLGKHVLDRTILDRDDRPAGKADDIVLELAERPGGGPGPAEVVAIVTGPMALARNLPRPLAALARLAYRLLGLPDPRPVEIPWRRITSVDVVVHVDVAREELGLMALAEAVDRRFIGRLPGAGVKP